MILETVKLQEEGSLPDAHVVFYILDTPGFADFVGEQRCAMRDIHSAAPMQSKSIIW